MSPRATVAVAGTALAGAAAFAGVRRLRREDPALNLPPYAPGHWLLGNIPEIRRNPGNVFLDAWRSTGDALRLRVGRDLYVFSHPDHVRYVLQESHFNFPHAAFLNNSLREVVGEAVVSVEGDEWKRHRRLTQPAFHKPRVAALCGVMAATIAESLESWQDAAKTGAEIEVRSAMMHISLHVLAQSLFGEDWSRHLDRLEPAVTAANEHLNGRMTAPIPLPLKLPLPGFRPFKAARRTFDELIYGTITERRDAQAAGAEPGDDLISMLLAATDEETGEPVSDRLVHDELMAFLMAGHETVSAALTWVWYLLWRHPEQWDRVRAEVDAVLGGRTPTMADLPNLAVTRRVVDETMRLYPPLFVAVRSPIVDDVIGGYDVPAGSMVMLSPYVTHRHPDFWDDPESFDPDRFTPERSAGRHRFAYTPFAAGPRKCIGDLYGLVGMQLVIAMVVQRYRLRLAHGARVEPQAEISMRPKFGLPMTVELAA